MRLPDGRVRKFRRSSGEPAEAHELTFSCYHGLPLLSKDRSRQWVIDALARARTTLDFELPAYVIMPEHVHALLLTNSEKYDVATILKCIKQPVAQRAVSYVRKNAPEWLNWLRVPGSDKSVVHRFWQQGGGYDRSVVTPRTAWASVEYIHANPVRRGLVDTPTDWVWSSARWYAGLDDVKLEMDECPPDVVQGLGGTSHRR
jgi:putative transposase